MDRVMLKVNSMFSRNGGIGRVIIVSMVSSRIGMLRLLCFSFVRLLCILLISCV